MKVPTFFRIHAQGLLVALVFMIGVSGAVAGTLQLRSSIYSPFAVSNHDSSAATGLGDTGAADRTTDTDGDGLTDYDEANVYRTSPYLADTDSDGATDGAEVKNGTDPNCPVGQVCSTSPAAPSATAPGSLVPPVQNPSVDELRNVLKQNGLPAAQVDAMSDEEVLTIYRDAVSDGPTGAASQAEKGSDPLRGQTPSTKTLAERAAEIRQLLIKNGVDEDKLKNVTDEELLQTYQQTIQEIESQK